MSRIEIWGVEGIGEIRPGDVLADQSSRRSRRWRPRTRTTAAARRRRARRDAEDRVEGRGTARRRSTPTTRCRTSSSSRTKPCGSSGGEATSSSPRLGTGSCAPTRASTCRTWNEAGPRCFPSTRTGRPAASATVVRARAGRHGGRDRLRHVRRPWRQGLTDVAIGCAGDRRRGRPARHPDALGPGHAGHRGGGGRRARRRGRDGDGQVRAASPWRWCGASIPSGCATARCATSWCGARRRTCSAEASEDGGDALVRATSTAPSRGGAGPRRRDPSGRDHRPSAERAVRRAVTPAADARAL